MLFICIVSHTSLNKVVCNTPSTSKVPAGLKLFILASEVLIIVSYELCYLQPCVNLIPLKLTKHFTCLWLLKRSKRHIANQFPSFIMLLSHHATDWACIIETHKFSWNNWLNPRTFLLIYFKKAYMTSYY